jgi:sodium transport system ATP-binding protein
MIQFDNVSKKFNLSSKLKKELGVAGQSVTAVDQVSFNCLPGRVFSILGPNGAGKTTILRMISTILKPTSGAIRVGGLDTVEHGKDVRAKIGFLSGTTGLYERLTPVEMVKYFADLYGLSATDYKQRKTYLFEMLGIGPFEKKKIGQLSSGMKQKVSIARTMVHDPEVVIFDEPTTGLDVITAKSIIELIRESKKNGKTVIFSSHIMSEVDLLCDDLLILHKGRSIFNNTMEEFKKEMTTGGLTEEFILRVNQSEAMALA